MTWLKLLRRKYSTILTLSSGDRWLLVHALWLLPVIAIAVSLKGMQFTQAMLLRLPLKSCAVAGTVESQVWATVRLVRVAVRYHRRWTNCLKQSLLLWILLRSQGILSEIRIGVGRESTIFTAHAWVEYQGIVLNDTEDVHQRYQAFDRSFEQSMQEKL
ncbi:lasso peptide biosynthesis B2 protein [Chamaesiphon sp.]|uniref:lasso peptide biosynthesis B2 protein n=1 Tax=Chamaesiphon sp. TaxID=2814140 RepID=UPI0035937B29